MEALFWNKNHSCLRQVIYWRILSLAGMLFLLSGLPVRAEDEAPILVDLEPPRIAIVQPLDSATITEERPWIEAEISDEDSGVNQDAIFISVNGVDVTVGAIIERLDLQEIGAAKRWRLHYQPPVALPPGQHRVQIDASDTAGNHSRRQWTFYLQEVPKPEVSWDASLTNTLNYSYLPLEQFHDTANFTSYLQLPGQLFTLQLQTSVTDYPGLRIEPNFYDYYLYLDQYTLGWQTNLFALQHGNINLPFESGLLLFGFGFKGSTLSNNNLSSQNWRIFKGTTVSSFGLGLSTIETSGGIYHWQTGAAKNQVYYLQMGKNQAKIVGFQDDRVLGQGILRSELIYGLGEKSGGGFRLQGATEAAGVFLDADCILLQESYPLPSLSPLPDTKGGAYQYALRGDKLFSNQKRVNFGYTYAANNLDGRAERTRQTQSWQLNLTGSFAPDLGWQFGYQAGKREEYGKAEQHLLKMGIHQHRTDHNWHSNLSFASYSTPNTMCYQLDLGYGKPWEQYGIKTAASLRYTVEDKAENQQSNKFRLRLTMEKDWFADLAKSYVAVAYQNNDEKNPAGGGLASEELLLEGALNLKAGKKNVIRVSGRVSFWGNGNSYQNRGTDYTLSLLWQTQFF